MPTFRRHSKDFPRASSPRGLSLRYQVSQLLRANHDLIAENNSLYYNRKEADSEIDFLDKRVDRLSAENARLKRENAALMERIADMLRAEARCVDRRHRSMSRARDRSDSPEWVEMPQKIGRVPRRRALRAPSPTSGGRTRRY